ncbi:MAG: type II toxin-antitoxin system VapC family toxin [Bacteroidaceae bacterium]|nr:type II toxin-antitoxin system VapC family toxin [Bacteroidaceae bacterium]
MTRKPSPFNSNHIFVDTNVLVGGYSGDARFQKDADCLHYLYSLTGKRLYISSLSVAQLISVYQKKKINDEIVRIVRDLQHRFNVIDFTNRDIDASLTETGADIEDNVQFVLARKQKCSIIVTNNYKDYRLFFNVRVVKPDEVRTIPQ